METEGNGHGESTKTASRGRIRRMLRGGEAVQRGVEVDAARLIPRLLDLETAALYLGVSPWTVRNLEAAGTLKRVAIPVGAKDLRKLLFDRTDLDALIERWKAS